MNISIKEIIFAIVIIALAVYFFKDLIFVLYKSFKGDAVIISEGKGGNYYGKCPTCGKKNEYLMGKNNATAMECVHCGEKVTRETESKQ